MSPDLASAIIVGLVAVLMFSLATLSGEEITVMRTLPWYVRLSALVFGTGCMARSVDLLDLSHHPEALTPGHINLIGLLCSMGLAAFIGSLVVYQASDQAPALTWARRIWAVKQIKENPDHVPVFVPISELTNIARADGLPSTGADEGASAVVHEMPRAAAAARRAAGG